jgi:serine/threonine protein kinase
MIPNPRARKKVMDTQMKQGRTFDTVFRDSNPLAVDLLRQMLLFDPTSRTTVEKALDHPYLAQLHYPEDEPTTDAVPRFDFEFERQLLTARDLKDLLYEDILLHHFPEKTAEYERLKAAFD